MPNTPPKLRVRVKENSGRKPSPNTVYTERNPYGKGKVIGKDIPVVITPDGRKIFAYNEKGIPVCNSRRANGKERCSSTFISDNGRCKYHGGKAPSGILHWNAKTLRTADSMPSHLKGDMVAALADEDRLSLNHEIALMDTKIEQQKKALETGLGGKAWKLLLELTDDLEFALETESTQRVESLQTQMIEIIRGGVKEREVWKEIDTSLEVRRRLTETAHKREMNLKSMLKGEQAFALMTGMASACKEQIASTFLAIQKKYKLIDRDTGIEASVIDLSFKNDFLSGIGIALGKLVSKPDKSADIQVPE